MEEDATDLLSLFCRRNILPTISSSYLKNCIYDPQTDPFCPIFRLGQIVEAAGQNFQEMAVEVFGRPFSWASAVWRRSGRWLSPSASWHELQDAVAAEGRAALARETGINST